MKYRRREDNYVFWRDKFMRCSLDIPGKKRLLLGQCRPSCASTLVTLRVLNLYKSNKELPKPLHACCLLPPSRKLQAVEAVWCTACSLVESRACLSSQLVPFNNAAPNHGSMHLFSQLFSNNVSLQQQEHSAAAAAGKKESETDHVHAPAEADSSLYEGFLSRVIQTTTKRCYFVFTQSLMSLPNVLNDTSSHPPLPALCGCLIFMSAH
jgi:hypothetical protein